MSTEDIPDGWAWARLDDLAAPGVGAITDGPFGSNLKTEHYTEVGPRVVRLQNIGNGVFVDARAHISGDRFVRLRRHEVVAGDLVLAMLGESLPRTCLIPQALGQAIVKADCARVRLDERLIDAKFVNLFLNSEPARRRTSKTIHGVGRPRIGLEGVKSLLVPVAPRPEQHRIVAELEQQLSRIDAGVAALERAKANLERYRASVLKAACEGRLVPTEAELARAEGRSFEPAGELLARILKERRARWEADQLARMKARGKPPKDDAWKKKYPEPAAPDTSALPELPEGWCWASLDALAWSSNYGTSEKCDYSFGGPAVLRIPNIVSGRVSLSDLKFARLDSALLNADAVTPGDFLIVRTNGSRELIGRGALITDQLERVCFFASYLIRFRLLPWRETSEWVASVWDAPMIRSSVMAEAATSAGQYNVRQSALARTNIPLPPAAEGRRIMEALEQSVTARGHAAKQLNQNTFRASRLRQSLLAHAFSGKLVPQDPNDEPASILLERIRKEREAQAASSPTRKSSARGASRRPRKASSSKATPPSAGKKRKRRDRS